MSQIEYADPAPRGAASVEMRQVTKAFGELVVLNQLDLDVDPGEVVVITSTSSHTCRPART